MFFTFEATSVRQSLKNFTSISTKLTTGNWSPDHTSRAPSPVLQDLPNPLTETIQNNIEKLNNYLKYFNDLSYQLKTNLDVELNKLWIKKSEMLAKIEIKFGDNMNDLKKIYNEKNWKISKKIKEISNEINKNLDLIGKVEKGNDIEEEFVDHLLRFSIGKNRFDHDWLKIRVNREIRKFGDSFKSQSDLISTLFNDDQAVDDSSKIRVYVPFGEPAYSFFYLSETGDEYTVYDLTASLQRVLEGGKLSIFLKQSKLDKEVALKPHERLSFDVRNTWPRLYVKCSKYN